MPEQPTRTSPEAAVLVALVALVPAAVVVVVPAVVVRPAQERRCP